MSEQGCFLSSFRDREKPNSHDAAGHFMNVLPGLVIGSGPALPHMRRPSKPCGPCPRGCALCGDRDPAESFARAVAFAISQPEDVDVHGAARS